MIFVCQEKELTYHKKVIKLERTTWKFFDYAQDGVSVIEGWYQDELSKEARFYFNNVLKTNRKIRKHREWVGFKGFLSGKPKKYRIWEIRFPGDKRQYRILGVFRPNRKAILLIGCYHKQRIYTPTSALEIACRRADLLEKGSGGYVRRKIKTDI